MGRENMYNADPDAKAPACPNASLIGSHSSISLQATVLYVLRLCGRVLLLLGL